MQIKKQTKKWKTVSGEEIRIYDMTDSHLLNSMKMLDRNRLTPIAGAMGDIRDCDVFEDDLPSIYFDLKSEAKRRKNANKKRIPKHNIG